MVTAYDSLTGMGKKVAEKLGIPYYDVNNFPATNEPILLLTRSYNFGEVTQQATEFLKTYAPQVVGVAVSGNRNWGTNYGAAGDKIAKQYGIPCILKYEGIGFPEDITLLKNWISNQTKGEPNDQ